jgi:lipopolysaccharide export system protein LptA
LTATADKAIYETKENGYVELIGNAQATQDGNSVTGDKLRLTNSNVAVADGNVRIIYIPEEQPAKPSDEKQDLA